MLRFCRLYRAAFRPVAEKFWSPFMNGIAGPDVSRYPVKETLRELSNGVPFTCQVNTIVGSETLVEDMFVAILTGFDILKVSMDPSPETATSFKGDVFVKHTRHFIGWKPTNTEFCLPYVIFFEGDGDSGAVSHLCLKVAFKESLTAAGCPENVLSIIESPESLKMLVALRRVRLKPEIISYGALASASRKTETWRDALGLL